jgi:hypothetical protein
VLLPPDYSLRGMAGNNRFLPLVDAAMSVRREFLLAVD